MDDQDYDEESTTIPARRARPIDFVVLAFILLEEIADAFQRVLDHTVGVLAGHANYKLERVRFADAIRSDLETIPTTEEQ